MQRAFLLIEKNTPMIQDYPQSCYGCVNSNFFNIAAVSISNYLQRNVLIIVFKNTQRDACMSILKHHLICVGLAKRSAGYKNLFKIKVKVNVAMILVSFEKKRLY